MKWLAQKYRPQEGCGEGLDGVDYQYPSGTDESEGLELGAVTNEYAQERSQDDGSHMFPGKFGRWWPVCVGGHVREIWRWGHGVRLRSVRWRIWLPDGVGFSLRVALLVRRRHILGIRQGFLAQLGCWITHILRKKLGTGDNSTSLDLKPPPGRLNLFWLFWWTCLLLLLLWWLLFSLLLLPLLLWLLLRWPLPLFRVITLWIQLLSRWLLPLSLPLLALMLLSLLSCLHLLLLLTRHATL
mmetsp:Transcript_27895/g.81945  ORF Transcript_27895/g.81945 Transcript_27895/m.81945 type:complete len:241 (+) Transcript_27895:1879-2601(+)